MNHTIYAAVLCSRCRPGAGRSRDCHGPTVGRSGMDFVLPGAFKAEKIVPDKDVAFCGKHPLFRENVVVDPATKGVKNVAVYLLAAPGKKVAVHPDYEKTAKDEVLLDNKNCRYEPHVLALRTSNTLVLGNSRSARPQHEGRVLQQPPLQRSDSGRRQGEEDTGRGGNRLRAGPVQHSRLDGLVSC